MDARVERVEKIVPQNAGEKEGGKREAISLRNDAIQRRELINQSWPHAAYPEKGRKKGERGGGRRRERKELELLVGDVRRGGMEGGCFSVAARRNKGRKAIGED